MRGYLLLRGVRQAEGGGPEGGSAAGSVTAPRAFSVRAGFLPRHLMFAQRPGDRRRADAHAGAVGEVLAQVLECGVGMFGQTVAQESEQVGAEDGCVPPAVGPRGERAPAAAQPEHLLDEGPADAEERGHLALRAQSLLDGLDHTLAQVF